MAIENTDVVIVGVGAAGGILAAELGKAGMKVIGLERGPRLATEDFTPHDELRFFQRQDLRPNIKRQPVTWRPNANVRATPLPVLNYGNQAGGGTVHYGSVSWRFHEDDFRARSHTIERYGAPVIPLDSSLADWPLSHADLEPYYDRAEYELGCRARPAICRATRSTAVMCSRRRAAVTIPCRPCKTINRASSFAARPRSSAITRFRRRARSCRKTITGGLAALIAAFARPSAAMSARSRAFSLPSSPRPMRPAISSWSPAGCAIASTAITAAGLPAWRITDPTVRRTRSRPSSSSSPRSSTTTRACCCCRKPTGSPVASPIPAARSGST